MAKEGTEGKRKQKGEGGGVRRGRHRQWKRERDVLIFEFVKLNFGWREVRGNSELNEILGQH